jgi:hypothetical protein
MRLRSAKGDRALTKGRQQWVATGNGHSEPPSDAPCDQTGIAEAETAGIYQGSLASIDASPRRAHWPSRFRPASVYRVLEAG